jgi:hypothetical protein
VAISKQILSGSTNGKGIKIAATSSPGTTIHTCSSSTSDIDEVWLYVSNPDSFQRAVTIQFGGTTSVDDDIDILVPPYEGLMLVVPGLTLKGNSTQLIIRAYVDVTNTVTVHGYVNRITQ